MNRDRRMIRTLQAIPLASLAMVLASGTPAASQAPPILSDVTGPAVTTGDQLAAMFAEPGTVRSMYCPVAWGVRTTAASVSQQLGASTLRPVLIRYGSELSAASQRRILALLTSPADAAASEQIVAALAPADNRQAAGAARRLVREARGLFDVIETINPRHPGTAGATRLSSAIGAYNSFIDASSAAFLARAPEELTALHAVLNSLVIATVENEGRAANVRSVDSGGLACATAAPPPEVVVRTPPLEHALEICLLVDREFRIVTALWRPETGDTVVVVGGERRPFSEVRRGAAQPRVPDWVVAQAPVTVNAVQYVPFGLPRSVRPGEMVPTGEIEGATYYVASSDRRSATPVLYFPVGSECLVQPYQQVQAIQIRG